MNGSALPLGVARLLPAAVAGLAALLGLVAAVEPTYAVAGAIGVAFVVLMLADLAVGLCLFAFSAAFFEAVPALGDVSLAKGVGLLLVLSWFANEAVSHRARRQLFSDYPVFSAVLALLVAWCVLTALWAQDSGATLSNCLRLSLNLLLIPIAYAAIEEPRQLRWLIGAFLAGVLGSTAYGLATGAAGAEGGRLAGAGLDPNYLALWLVVACTLATGLVVRRRASGPLRLALFAAMLFCGFGLVQTASRGGLLALAVVGLTAPLLAGPRRRLPAATMAALVAGACILYFTSLAPAYVTERITAQDGGSGRTDIWRVAWRMVEEEPVTGVGLGNFRTSSISYLIEPGLIRRSDHIVDQGLAVHNTYLELWAETGAVGLALYLLAAAAALWWTARAARMFTRAGLHDEELLARCVLLAMTAVMAGSFFVSAEYTKPLWLLLALGPVLHGLARRMTDPREAPA